MRATSLFTLVLVSTIGLACGGTSGNSSGGGGQGTPSAGAQTWTGTWLSQTGVGGDETLDITLSGTTVFRTVSFTNSPCFSSGDISGTLVNGALSATVTAGAIKVTIDATMTGDQLSGTYDSVSAGACTGDTGTVSATKS